MANRLAECQSLYLRKHAHNPIDWWPWCPEALAKAEAENKPLFVSIGYSSCHWCTVMEGEAFSNAAIAAYMNEHFVAIKVDREERPDLDSIYMQALQLMSGQGGWPLNIFLTPQDRVPFYAGTYFPVDPRFGRPGFLEVLQRIRQFYDGDKDRLERHKEQLLDALNTISELSPSAEIPSDYFATGITAIIPLVSREGSRQQFPMMPYAQLALRASRFRPDPAPADPVAEASPDVTTVPAPPEVRGEPPRMGTAGLAQSTIDGPDALIRAQQRGMDLVLGGIFDHVGGGFHRYTVDPTWTVPHFEKMLYDNGQILEFLADLWAAGFQDWAIERAVRKTVEWLRREMTDPAGYFYASQDADSLAQPEDIEPEEGEFYVWRQAQLQELLSGEQFDELEKAFDISVKGNFSDRPGLIVLQRRQAGTLDPMLEDALEVLFQARYGELDPQDPFPPAIDAEMARQHPWTGRIPPVTDTKMIVAWNSLMISGLARAAVVFEQADFLKLALPALRFILNTQSPEGRLLRLNYNGIPAVSAKSEDYALLIKALLDVHQASLTLLGEPSPQFWLDQAIDLQQQMDQTLWDPRAGGYFISGPTESGDLLVREKEFQDNATPAANGIAAANLVRLAYLTDDLKYLDRAETEFRVFGQMMRSQPRSCPSLFAALDWYQNILKVTLEHPYGIQQGFWPTTMFVTPSEPLGESVAGLVCVGLKCLDPAASLDQVIAQMRQGQVRS